MDTRPLASVGVGLLLGLIGSAHAADITYGVDRIIGAGTVVGSITTNGTIGVLTQSDIVAWTLTLTDPHLVGGSPDVITSASGAAGLNGDDLVASATQLTWNFGPSDGADWVLEGSDGNYWCGANAGSTTCNFEMDPAETMGHLTGSFGGDGGQDEEAVAQSGEVVIATASTSVPEPAGLALMGLGLAGVGFAARRRKT